MQFNFLAVISNKLHTQYALCTVVVELSVTHEVPQYTVAERCRLNIIQTSL